MIFLLDTTTNPTTIGLYDYKDLKIKIVESSPENNKKLISIIEKFGNSLKIKNWKLKIDSVGVICGPGTFTGVRTGVVIANTFGYALKVPLYAVDTLTAQAPTMITDIVSLLSASNNEVYFARFKKGKIQGKIEIVDTMNIANRLSDGDIVVGDLGEKHCGLITKQEFVTRTSSDRIKNLLDLILCKKIKPAKQVLPLYIKKPNITQANPKKKLS
jgi:tRNA threonylcarbamoyl adenosine modification protein YeaZ